MPNTLTCLALVFFLPLVRICSSTEDKSSGDKNEDAGTCNLQNLECQGETESSDKRSKYTQQTNFEAQLLQQIKEAEKDYGNEQVISYDELISKDLAPYSKTGVTEEKIRKAIKRGVLYQIRNHKLYRSKDCNFPARCSGVEHFILKVIRDLDDMEFVINVSDWPQNNWYMEDPVPVLSFSKSGDFLDILYPAWTFWEGGPAISIYPKGIGRWDIFRKLLIDASKKWPWEKKSEKGFFRGSRTSSERDPLILLSREYAELVDAQYTKNQAWKSDKDTLGMPAAKEVTFQDHCQYKYLFNYRGVAASFRFKHLFLCNSLVFQVGNEWIEYFYPILKPWIHYIPVESTATKEEIRSLLKFAKSHDEVVQKIAQRGFEWFANNLKLEHITEYWKQLLTSYGKLLRYEVQTREGLEEIH